VTEPVFELTLIDRTVLPGVGTLSFWLSVYKISFILITIMVSFLTFAIFKT